MLYRDAVLKIARSQIGVCEQPNGSNTGPQVRKYQAATTLGGSGWPWCDAFVAWCFREAGLPLKDPSASTVQSLHDAIKDHTLTDPFPGAIVLYDFPGGDVVDHTGIVERVTPGGDVVAIEGNTSPSDGGSQGNGGCVARKERPLSVCKAFYRVPGVRTPVPVKKRPIIHGKAAAYKILQKFHPKWGYWTTDVTPNINAGHRT